MPWKRPGFELGLWLEKFCIEHPKAKGVILESHGLFTWGDTPEECYATTLWAINTAATWLEAQQTGKDAFGGAATKSLSTEERRAKAASLMPSIRGLISGEHRMVGHFDDSAAVLEFVNSKNLRPLAALGTSCPDHFLRTKIRPLVVEDEAKLAEAIEAYRKDYAAYYEGLQARQLAADARCQSGGVSGAAGRHDHLRQGQGDGAHFR